MQESRLFKIVYHILDRGKATGPELAEKFDVSVRTIYRDIDIISGMGIPIYATQGKGGGIALLDSFVLDRALLSEQEKEQILMALQSLLVAGQRDFSGLLTKLGGLFQSNTASWIEVDFSGWVKNSPGQDVFSTVQNAIFSRNVLCFQYYGSSGNTTQRLVEPLKLVFKSKDWYLYGFCKKRDDFRFFKLTRMRELAVQPETFSRRPVASCLTAAQAMPERTVPVTLKFAKEAAFRVFDEFADAVTQDDLGYLYVKTLLPESDALYSYVLSFADSVEVLEPHSVRERIKEKLSEMQKKYRT